MSTSTFRIAVTEQENKNAFASKKGHLTNSTRKPLTDRATNETPAKQRAQPLPIKPKSVVKSAPKTSPKINEFVYPDWCADICSYNQVEDMYEYTVWPKSERIDIPEFLKAVSNCKTPPPKDKDDVQFLPELMQLPAMNDFEHTIDYIPKLDMDVDVLDYFF